jgi:hypothetical protein
MTCPNPPLQETETICESGPEYLNRLSALARIGAPRQASAFADAKDTLPVGAGQPPAEGPHAD